MPAEFDKHAGTWMLWPERPDNWRLGGKPAQRAFVETAAAIRKHEPLTVGVNEDQYENAVHRLPEDVRVVEITNDDAWVRDCGPTFVVNRETSEVRGVDWKFNACGRPYFPWKKDDQIARKICDMEYKSRYRLDNVVLEGGCVDTDGDGTILTTEECLLSAGRNPDLSKEELTEILCSYLGAEKVIWLKQGIYLDETNGHVDNICRFAEPGKVFLAWTDDESEPQYEISKQNLEILKNETDAKGRRLEIVKLPMPAPMCVTAEEAESIDIVRDTLTRPPGTRLAASYVNFYFVNGGLIVPQFGDPMDDKAVEILGECFPEREIEKVYAREILLGGGNIHCITQQQPAAPAKPRPPVVAAPAILIAAPPEKRETKENDEEDQ